MAVRHVLLDLGNVVVGVDFRRVFSAWAQAAQVDEQVFHDNWALDDAYKAHETGQLSFEPYSQHLAGMFGVTMSADQWMQGWNQIWTRPFGDVVRLLPDIAARYRLFAFSNTNPEHEAHFKVRYADALAEFREVFTSSTLGARKPDVQAYQLVCERMGADPSEVFFLDDTLENIEGATAAGLNAWHCRGEPEVVGRLQSLLAENSKQ